MKTVFVAVGFRLDRKRAIGYYDYDSEAKTSQKVYELLLMGADVISIRRVKLEDVSSKGKA